MTRHIEQSERMEFRPRALSLSVMVASLMWAGVSSQVFAQEDAAAEIESITVTGSRVQRDGYSAPTPVSVLSEEDIAMEAPASIADFVNTMPAVQGSTTSSSSSGSLSSGAAGIAAMNLRGLGTGRTLVLFDGQRSVVSASTGQVDSNTFPQSLVSRVEVVTGGASAAYGSDAIGGVVNFILDREYTGFKTEVQYGETFYDDDANHKIVATAGFPFADGNGHVLLSGERFESDGAFDTVRDWNTHGYQGILNPDRNVPGQPHFLVGEGIGISAYTPGGLITSGPLKGTYFGVDGSVNQLAYGEESGQWMIGGDWDYATSGMQGSHSLAAADVRESMFGRVSYDLTPTTSAFFQGSWAGYEGESYYISPTDRGRTIYADNAFLPASVKTQMDTLGLDSFVMGTSNEEFPIAGSNNGRETTRLVAGLEGSFDLMDLGFEWDTYYQNGVTETDEHMLPIYNFDRLTMATDAVFHPDTGAIVCRSSIADPGNGCVPMNRFGIGVTSQESIDYIMGRPRRLQDFTQNVAAINFSTSDITGWTGPISLAFGAEYRTEEIDGFVAPEHSSGWKYGNYKVTTGDYNVAEAYIETVFGIIENLEFNGAARYADYSTSGGVTTWKAGLTYAMTDDITLRATRSRDIRAPNLSELYDAGTARTNAVNIAGESMPFIQNLQGNPVVAPEEADSVGLGIVYQPSFLPGFSTAVDYYDIEINGIINFVGAQSVADFCYLNGVQRYCDNINFVDGRLSTIDLYYENLNSMQAEGVDVEATYRFGIEEMFGSGAGDVTLRAMATHYMKDIEDNGVTAINQAGSNAGSSPDWSYRLTASYRLEDFSMNLTARGVSDGVLSNAYTECSNDCPASSSPYFTINDNSVPGETYFDAYLAKTFMMGDSGAELFVSVKNILDTDPVLIAFPANQGSENRPGYLPTNRSHYDVMGRTYRIGARFEF